MQLQRDEAMRSIGMAMQTLMVSAKALGYESCPMIGFEHEKVAELINLPGDHCIGPMVAIGKGTKEAWPKPGQLSYDEVVVRIGSAGDKLLPYGLIVLLRFCARADACGAGALYTPLRACLPSGS